MDLITIRMILKLKNAKEPLYLEDCYDKCPYCWTKSVKHYEFIIGSGKDSNGKIFEEIKGLARCNNCNKDITESKGNRYYHGIGKI